MRAWSRSCARMQARGRPAMCRACISEGVHAPFPPPTPLPRHAPHFCCCFVRQQHPALGSSFLNVCQCSGHLILFECLPMFWPSHPFWMSANVLPSRCTAPPPFGYCQLSAWTNAVCFAALYLLGCQGSCTGGHGGWTQKAWSCSGSKKEEGGRGRRVCGRSGGRGGRGAAKQQWEAQRCGQCVLPWVLVRVSWTYNWGLARWESLVLPWKSIWHCTG